MSYKVYTCTYAGVWLQANSVAVAADKGHVKRQLTKLLGYEPTELEITEIPIHKAGITELDDGDY